MWLRDLKDSVVLQFYTIASVLLFTARFVTYHKKRWHYYFLVRGLDRLPQLGAGTS